MSHFWRIGWCFVDNITNIIYCINLVIELHLCPRWFDPLQWWRLLQWFNFNSMPTMYSFHMSGQPAYCYYDMWVKYTYTYYDLLPDYYYSYSWNFTVQAQVAFYLIIIWIYSTEIGCFQICVHFEYSRDHVPTKFH